MGGRVVTLSGPITRIITTFKPATTSAFSLGLQARLVGVDNSSTRDRLHRNVHPEIAEVAHVGSKSSGLNFETLVALEPQLVILYAYKDGLLMADRLEQVGIPSLIILPESFDGIRETLTLIASAVGEPERAERVIVAMDRILELVAHRVVDLNPEERKRGYFASSRGLFNTATGNMLQDEILSLSGVSNVAHNLRGHFQDISPEQFIVWDPEIVILSQRWGGLDLAVISNPALQQVRAFRDGEIHRCPSDLGPWDFPSPLSVLCTLWLAHKAYPTRFTSVEMEREINGFHTSLFGKSLLEMGGRLNDQVE